MEHGAKNEKRERFYVNVDGPTRVYPPYAWVIRGCFGSSTFRLWQWIGSQCERVGIWLDRLGDRLAPYGDPIRGEKRRRAWDQCFDDND